MMEMKYIWDQQKWRKYSRKHNRWIEEDSNVMLVFADQTWHTLVLNRTSCSGLNDPYSLNNLIIIIISTVMISQW